MDWPSTCPVCASKHANIHGMVYRLGASAGDRCDHDWHKGPGYDPSNLNLTDADRAFLIESHIRTY